MKRIEIPAAEMVAVAIQDGAETMVDPVEVVYSLPRESDEETGLQFYTRVRRVMAAKLGVEESQLSMLQVQTFWDFMLEQFDAIKKKHNETRSSQQPSPESLTTSVAGPST